MIKVIKAIKYALCYILVNAKKKKKHVKKINVLEVSENVSAVLDTTVGKASMRGTIKWRPTTM